MPIDAAALSVVVNRTANVALERMAREGAEVLRANLKRGSRSGVKYPDLPARSSTKDEFPQRQSGELRDAVDAWQLRPLLWAVGIRNGPVSVKALEYGLLSRNLEGRHFMLRTFVHPMVRARMLAKAVKR